MGAFFACAVGCGINASGRGCRESHDIGLSDDGLIGSWNGLACGMSQPLEKLMLWLVLVVVS